MGGRDEVKPEDLKPGTVAGELDVYDNVIKPIVDNRKQNEGRDQPQGNGKP